MNGELAFTLGLEGGRFLGVANSATRAIVGLVGAAYGAKSIVSGIFDAFERGAALQQLHARTGEAVKDLFLLQRGMQAVGLQSDEIGRMLFHLQKGLTGISDVGEDTTAAFAVMGLSMLAIRKMDAPQQFAAIAAAINKLDLAMAAGVAGKLFGREGAANFLQLARSSELFTQSMKDNAAAAEQMARNSAAFQKIEVSMLSLREKSENLFAGIAGGLAPGLQTVLDMLNKFDLTGIGKSIGDVIAGFAQTIKDAKFGELLSLSLNAGVEEFSNFFLATLAGIHAAMAKTFTQQDWRKALRGELGIALGLGVAGLTGKASGYDVYRHGVKELGVSGGGIPAFTKEFDNYLSHAGHGAAKELMDFLGKEAARAPKPPADQTEKPRDVISAAMKSPQFTSAEKMGFVFSAGGPTILADHARATAVATQQTAANTGRMLTQLDGLKSFCQAMGIPWATTQSTAAR